MLPVQSDRLEIDGAIIYPFPADSAELKGMAVNLRPSWLLIGEDGNDDSLSSVVALARQLLPKLKLGVFGPLDDLDRCEHWLRLGANLYLGTDTRLDRALEAMRAVDELDVELIDDRFRKLALDQRAALTMLLLAGGLSKRERDVLRLLRFGLKNTDIAAALDVSESTVEFHVHNILNKLRASNRTEAAAHASILGL